MYKPLFIIQGRNTRHPSLLDGRTKSPPLPSPPPPPKKKTSGAPTRSTYEKRAPTARSTNSPTTTRLVHILYSTSILYERNGETEKMYTIYVANDQLWSSMGINKQRDTTRKAGTRGEQAQKYIAYCIEPKHEFQ